jgi:hypothetical protein
MLGQPEVGGMFDEEPDVPVAVIILRCEGNVGTAGS